MKIFGFLIFIVLATAAIKESAAQINCADHEANIALYGFNDSSTDPFILKLDEQPEDYGIGSADNVSIIVHGWLEGLNTTAWVNTTIINLLKHRHGTVFFFDYSQYSKNGNYGRLVPHYEKIAAVLTKYLLLIGNPERIFMYGFSFGARLAVEAGIASFNGSIDRIDLCDPAGVGFDGTPRAKVPTLAAQNVACIDTSTNYGTGNYNCHQNFRMGACGSAQAAHGSYPKGSHGLCPYMYNAAFDFDYFIPYNHYVYRCGSARQAKLTSEVRMGFLGISAMNKTDVRGDIFIATSGAYPYVAADPRWTWYNATSFNALLVRFEALQFSKREDADDAAMVVMRNDVWWEALKLATALEIFIKEVAQSAPYEMDHNKLFHYQYLEKPDSFKTEVRKPDSYKMEINNSPELYQESQDYYNLIGLTEEDSNRADGADDKFDKFEI